MSDERCQPWRAPHATSCAISVCAVHGEPWPCSLFVVSEHIEEGWVIGDLSICTYDEMACRQLSMVPESRRVRTVKTLADGSTLTSTWRRP